MSYHHLTVEQREKIFSLKEKLSYADIADEVGCHKSTISIKLSRNGVLSGYSGVRAQKRYLECRVLGKHGTGCLVTLAGKLSGKHADPFLEVVTKLLEGKPCETITFDKGKEFARHQEIGNALGTKVYFSHPNSPWEPGTNEGKHERTASAVLPQGEKHDSG